MTYVIHGLLHLITALVAIAVCLWLGLTTPTPRIVEVDSDLLLQRFAQDASAGTQEETVQQTRVFLRDMEVVLRAFALENGVVVVDAELAIAGARDVTDQAYEAALSLQTGVEGDGS